MGGEIIGLDGESDTEVSGSSVDLTYLYQVSGQRVVCDVIVFRHSYGVGPKRFTVTPVADLAVSKDAEHDHPGKRKGDKPSATHAIGMLCAVGLRNLGNKPC